MESTIIAAQGITGIMSIIIVVASLAMIYFMTTVMPYLQSTALQTMIMIVIGIFSILAPIFLILVSLPSLLIYKALNMRTNFKYMKVIVVVMILIPTIIGNITLGVTMLNPEGTIFVLFDFLESI